MLNFLPIPLPIPKKWRRFRLRTVLVVPFVIPIMVSTGLVGWFSFHNGQRAIDELATQLNSEISNRIKQHVLEYLHKPYQFLQVTEAGIQSGNLDLTNFEGLQRYFWYAVQSDELPTYPYFANEQGEFIGVERREDDTIQLKIRTVFTEPVRETYELDAEGNRNQLLAKFLYDPRTRPWYQAAKQVGKPTWSPIFPAFSRQNTSLDISPVRPLYDRSGNLLGVLSLNLPLVQITEFLKELYISPHGQSFIIERSGELVVSSEISQPFIVKENKNERDIERISALKSSNIVVQATVQHLLDRFRNFQAIADRKYLKFPINGIWHYAEALPIQDGRGIDWLTVVVVPESDFMARINANNRTTLILCLITFISATAIGILTARWISKQIFKLNKASQLITQGDLNQKVSVIGIIEIENLAQSFNSMAGQLKESFETLEDRVQERTTQLAQANQEITSLNHRLKAENLRMSAELDLLRKMQQMILPKPEELESILGLEIAGFMEPAQEVGGDYYDILTHDGVVTIGIGDVTGHGLESGILMVMTQTAVRTLQEMKESDSVTFLDTLNRTIYGNVQRMNSDKNLTLSVLNYYDKKVSISGQHEEIIIVRLGGTIERIDTLDLGFPIGLEAEISKFIDNRLIELQPGESLILYTDGITEAIDTNNNQYGVERLCEVVSQHWQETAEQIKKAVIDDLWRHIGQQKVFDDITLLVIKQR